MSAALRVLHFSDVHLESGFKGVPKGQFFNKRFAGYLNLALHRRVHFAGAEKKVQALAELIERESVDVALCTGDYTALGTRPELEYAWEILKPVVKAPSAYVTVPGNHDVYLDDAIADGRFDQVFGDVLTTDMPEVATDDGWPRVRFFGEELVIITINSARPNPSIRLSSGRVPDAQLEALAGLLRHERVRDRFVMVATHYAPRLANGRPDAKRHGLDNADAVLRTCAPVARGVLCHGHVHHNYRVREPGLRMDLMGAGSATHKGREGLWMYEVGARAAFATPGTWTGERYELDTSRRVQLNS